MNDLSGTKPVASSNVQRVVTPAGIEAWLVEEYAVPVIACEFAFTSGASDDPAPQAGLSSLLIRHGDRSAR